MKSRQKQNLTPEQREALEKVVKADLALAEDLRETLETMPWSIRRMFDTPDDPYDEH